MEETEKYEVELLLVDSWDEECIALVSMLTGYGLDELGEKLEPRLLKSSGWYARDFSTTFRNLGFDCSPKFKAFDENTPYPCLMRYGWTNDKGRKCWSVEVYYNGFVYDPMSGIWGLSLWKKHHSHCKITSMMQVWISDL